MCYWVAKIFREDFGWTRRHQGAASFVAKIEWPLAGFFASLGSAGNKGLELSEAWGHFSLFADMGLVRLNFCQNKTIETFLNHVAP